MDGINVLLHVKSLLPPFPQGERKEENKHKNKKHYFLLYHSQSLKIEFKMPFHFKYNYKLYFRYSETQTMSPT